MVHRRRSRRGTYIVRIRSGMEHATEPTKILKDLFKETHRQPETGSYLVLPSSESIPEYRFNHFSLPIF